MGGVCPFPLPWMQTPPGYVTCDACWEATPPPTLVDRMKDARETLPCPKLRLRAVNIVAPPPSTKTENVAYKFTIIYQRSDHTCVRKRRFHQFRPPRSGVIINSHKSFLNLGSVFEDAIERPLSVHYAFSCSWPCP